MQQRGRYRFLWLVLLLLVASTGSIRQSDESVDVRIPKEAAPSSSSSSSSSWQHQLRSWLDSIRTATTTSLSSFWSDSSSSSSKTTTLSTARSQPIFLNTIDPAVAFTAVQAVVQMAVAVAAGVWLNWHFHLLDRTTVSSLAKLTYRLLQPSLAVVSVATALHKAQPQDVISTSSDTTTTTTTTHLSQGILFCMPLLAVLELALGYLLGKGVVLFWSPQQWWLPRRSRMRSTQRRGSSKQRQLQQQQQQKCLLDTQDQADILLSCTFSNSAPLPLLFAHALFSGDAGGMEQNVTACISFYLIVWSPCLYLLGPLLLLQPEKRKNTKQQEPETAAVASSQKQQTQQNHVFLFPSSIDEDDASYSNNKKLDSTSSETVALLLLPPKDDTPVSKYTIKRRSPPLLLAAASVRHVVRILYQSPPFLASVVGLTIGKVPILRDLFFQSNLLGAPIMGALRTFAAAYLPCTILILAGSLLQSDDDDNDDDDIGSNTRDGVGVDKGNDSRSQEWHGADEDDPAPPELGVRQPIFRRAASSNAESVIRDGGGGSAARLINLSSSTSPPPSGALIRARTSSYPKPTTTKDEELTAPPGATTITSKSRLSVRVIVSLIIARLLIFPLFHIVLVQWIEWWNPWNLVYTTPTAAASSSSTGDSTILPVFSAGWLTLRFVWQMLVCMPPAQNTVLILQLQERFTEAAHLTRLLAVLYAVSVVPMTLWVSQALSTYKNNSNNNNAQLV